MRVKSSFALIAVFLLIALGVCTSNAIAVEPGGIEVARSKEEYSRARLEAVKFEGEGGLAVIFEGTDDLHYYANSVSAPAKGLELKVQADSNDFGFGEAVFPKWKTFTDPFGKNVEVYAGNFTVILPIKFLGDSVESSEVKQGGIEVKISGIACTSKVCLRPFKKSLKTRIDLSQSDSWRNISIEKASTGAETVSSGPAYPVLIALGLAFLAGLSLNIMPCVWPVLPIIVMRIVEAVANIVLQVFYGTVLQWGDQFRNPVFLGVMAMLLVVMALFMFGVFSISLPSSVTGKTDGGQGYSGAIGMGYLAAILSTPCSFAILAAAFAWAQAQHWSLGTLSIMVIGVGMSIPYAILTLMPGLLKRLPRAGRWMELFKQALGFVLLVIAVKLIAALPQLKRMSILYFALVLSFSVWMWGSWVSFNTRLVKKLLIRTIAVLLVLSGGYAFLYGGTGEAVQWQKYDEAVIVSALSDGKPVLIKFMADWCFNCVVVDKVVYSRKDIVRLIREKGVLAIKADTTQDDYPATIALKNKYKEPGVPVSILYIGGEEVRWRGLLFADELKGHLEKLVSP